MTDEPGSRTPVSGPTARSPPRGAAWSVYYVGAALEVTETVGYALGDRGVKAHYVIRNTSSKPVDFRAAELATVNAADSASGGDSVGVFGADGSGTRIEPGVNPWAALQAGAGGGSLDVYDAFAHAGLNNQIADGGDTDQLGVEWKVEGLKPDDTRALELVWAVADAKTEVVVTTTTDGPQPSCTKDGCTLRAALASTPAGSSSASRRATTSSRARSSRARTTSSAATAPTRPCCARARTHACSASSAARSECRACG